MKKSFLIVLLTGIGFYASAQRNQAAPAALIPLPVQVQWAGSSFVIDRNTALVADAQTADAATLLNAYIWQKAGIVLTDKGEKRIVLTVDKQQQLPPEGYKLHADGNEVRITAYDTDGIVHGIATLRQLWQPANGQLLVPGTDITDYPRFHYRGMHLDVCRHFFSVDFIKQLIDQLALYKINNFHWHLTDDQGWRIEIKKYPKLQSIAAWRDQTMIGHKKELPHQFDGQRYGGYYTQEQIKEVVSYAATRHINVIPEIDMPGHALAALNAYPELGCTKGPYKTAQFWGIFDDVFCAGNDSTFTFLQDVFDEVMTLFPSQYIHLGGDECPKVRWEKCPACQKRMKEEGLKDEHALQSYFVKRISNYIQSKGRKVIGWDEILEGGLAPGATVMSWRGVDGAIAAAKQQHHVIMTPEDELYFDHYQSLYPQEPVAAGGYTPLEEVYNYDPLHAAGDTALLPYISGMQGQMWSEYLPTEAHAQYMIYPRMLAMAERAWSPQSTRDYHGFLTRLRGQESLLTGNNIHPSDVYNEINYRLDSVSKGALHISLHADAAKAQIRYTLNGMQPTAASKLYDGPFTVTASTTIRAALFEGNQQVYREFSQPVMVNKSTGAAITLKEPPNTKYNANAATLVNGIVGTHRFNDGQWLGFSKRDLDAVIDLGTAQPIRVVATNVLNYHWQKMWAPSSLEFQYSVDGVHYLPLAKTKTFLVNGINNVRIQVKPVKARYIRMVAVNRGVIPAGEYGAGGNSMLLLDEIIVN
ncbi:family 20 glycosylhydrolase [Chitinophaga sp. Cy-1792]|uniref:glycoside hydrolase family 20 protein n=1 Tax=Chitinophaga sp. Cy-1792 TaxID=2608339 RepID=UPI001422F1E1|nr:family 20 glycosylhydrolase [Chitinophaga sp. Cy-1792]NIG54924.1 family 20 glycosylhydrolase [Chitinophaga sp. Cy-1792]